MFAVIICVLAICVGILYLYLTKVPALPVLDLDKWWGVGDKPAAVEDRTIRPFKIEFEEKAIEDLYQRLKNRRPFTKPLEGIQSQYGMNTDYLQTVINYWTEKYEFKRRVELLNEFSHYKTKIQGLDIHYIRAKPHVKEGVKVLPLLMLHGWPSSSKEFVKVIPLLTTPHEGYDFAFEVIAADLPGYGFSQGTTKPGLDSVHMGIIMRNLMMRIGFEKFYIQAGDWGAQCATHMATLFPHQILGYHSNIPLSSRRISYVKLILGSLYPTFVDPVHWKKAYPLTKWIKYVLRESGYFHLQMTKPDTIGVALTDSPAGLAAYLMEKIAICAHRDQLDTVHGGLDNLDMDDVLDTVSIMWLESKAVTSMRLYAEGFSRNVKILQEIPTRVPFGAIKFEHEIAHQPDWILKDKFPNLVSSTTLDFGGHFAALHTPKVLADDVFSAVSKFIKFQMYSKA